MLKEVVCVLIAVQYRNGTFDMVKNKTLDELITSESVALFRRASGWVVVDRDFVRHTERSDRYYMGVERRTVIH